MLETPPLKELDKFVSGTDDNEDLNRLPEAELILMGVSGGGKTILSDTFKNIYRIKAANVAIVSRNDAPYVSFDMNEKYIADLKAFVKSGRPFIVGLVCPVDEIILRRRSSDKYNKKSKIQHGVEYGKGHQRFIVRDSIDKDVKAAEMLYNKIGCACVNVAGLTPEEEAKKIIEVMAKARSPIAAYAKIRKEEYS